MRTTMKALLSRSLPLLLGIVGAVAVVDDAHAADWDIYVVKTSATTADLSWKAEVGTQYMICWKRDSASGDVCGYGSQHAEANIYTPGSGLGNSNYVNGRKTVRMHSLTTCNVEYKVRIRRTLLAFDTQVFWFPC